MKLFSGNYQETIRNRRNALVYYSLGVVFILLFQSYFIFIKFIPTNIEVYSNLPDVQNHVKKIISIILDMWMINSFLAIVAPLSGIVSTYFLLSKSIDD